MPYPYILSETNKTQAQLQGLLLQNLPNGYPRYPSFGEMLHHILQQTSFRGSARLPSVGEESTHPLLVAEEQVSIAVQWYCMGLEYYYRANT